MKGVQYCNMKGVRYIVTLLGIVAILRSMLTCEAVEQDTCPIPAEYCTMLELSKPGYPRDCSEVASHCSDFTEGVYWIKPDGFLEPFEVFCDVDGWAIIQRRTPRENTLVFNRTWESYKHGFGFPSGEFWLGNEKLSFLTNQKNYRLQLVIQLTNGSSLYKNYHNFRIGDGLGEYRLVSLVETIDAPPIKINRSESRRHSTLHLYVESHTPEFPRDCSEIQSYCSASNTYWIKPDGYDEPFEVYCDDAADSGGWTVISRRDNANRTHVNGTWDMYKSGFGSPDEDYFWLGNDKLSYLTNQKDYKLLMEITTNAGLTTVLFQNFRISDEHSHYKLVNVDFHSGETDHIEWCGENMEYRYQRCHTTCENPTVCTDTFSESESCVCPDGFYVKNTDDCVPVDECGCYVPEKHAILEEGESYGNCDISVTCRGQMLYEEERSTCSEDADCAMTEEDSVKCSCGERYTGNGKICISVSDVRDCQDLYMKGVHESGVYTIQPSEWSGDGFNVSCNMSGDGGWTVFQRRINGSERFEQGTFEDYKDGFGNLRHEFWLGNEKLHHLTKRRRYKIRFDLVTDTKEVFNVTFDFFRIKGEEEDFKLSEVGNYSGNADPSDHPDGAILQYHYLCKFTTEDDHNYRDLSYSFSGDDYDGDTTGKKRGPWWYCGGNETAVYINGRYGDDFSIKRMSGHSRLIYSELKILPV